MKKIFNLLLMSAVLSLGLVGCGGSEEAEAPAESSEAAETSGTSAGGEINVVSREDGSGTRAAFVEITGVESDAGDETFAEAAIQNSTDGVMSTVAGDAAAIGYISLGSMNDTVKAVKVEGAEASVEAIKSGDYPIARPFNIIYKQDEASDLVKDFVAYIHSAEGKAIIEGENYIPMDENAPAYTGDGSMKGQITIGGSTSVAPIVEKIAEAYMEANPDVEINIEATGSGAGVTGAVDGTLDIGMASRELKDEEKAQIHGEEIALDGIAVIVNTENAIEEISVENIAKIFKGELRTWEEVK